jgi:hypothetical protein
MTDGIGEVPVRKKTLYMTLKFRDGGPDLEEQMVVRVPEAPNDEVGEAIVLIQLNRTFMEIGSVVIRDKAGTSTFYPLPAIKSISFRFEKIESKTASEKVQNHVSHHHFMPLAGIPPCQHL